MTEKKPLFYYSPSERGKRRITICGVLLNHSTISFGIANCSTKDNFTREKGRRVSTGRALNKPVLTAEIPENAPLGKFFHQVATQIADIALNSKQASLVADEVKVKIEQHAKE